MMQFTIGQVKFGTMGAMKYVSFDIAGHRVMINHVPGILVQDVIHLSIDNKELATLTLGAVKGWEDETPESL